MLIAAFIISSTLSFVLCLILVVILVERMRMRRIAQMEHQKNILLTVFSHQIRTPMTSIKWYTEMLLGQEYGALKVSQLEFLKKIDSSVSTVVKSLNSFLSLHRLERGSIVSHPTTVDLQNGIEYVIASLKEEWKDRKQTISFVREKGAMGMHVDMFLLHGILDIILSNAIRYTPKEGVIAVSASTNVNEAIVQVKDTGIGMTEQEQRHVFAKFFRGEKAKQLYSNGDGLGLCLVKQILEDMGGSIAFTSKEGEGTTFILRIPRTVSRRA